MFSPGTGTYQESGFSNNYPIMKRNVVSDLDKYVYNSQKENIVGIELEIPGDLESPETPQVPNFIPTETPPLTARQSPTEYSIQNTPDCQSLQAKENPVMSIRRHKPAKANSSFKAPPLVLLPQGSYDVYDTLMPFSPPSDAFTPMADTEPSALCGHYFSPTVYVPFVPSLPTLSVPFVVPPFPSLSMIHPEGLRNDGIARLSSKSEALEKAEEECVEIVGTVSECFIEGLSPLDITLRKENTVGEVGAVVVGDGEREMQEGHNEEGLSDMGTASDGNTTEEEYFPPGATGIHVNNSSPAVRMALGRNGEEPKTPPSGTEPQQFRSVSRKRFNEDTPSSAHTQKSRRSPRLL
jgi:hypothetical protein